MFKIVNENLSPETVSYLGAAPGFVLKGRETPAIQTSTFANFGENKGFSEVEYPLPNPYLLQNYFDLKILENISAEIVDTNVDSFFASATPQEIVANSFFYDETKIGICTSLIEGDSLQIVVKLNYIIPFSLKLALPVGSTVTEVLMESGVMLSLSVNPSIPGTFVQSDAILSLFGDSYQYEIEPGMSCEIQCALNITLATPTAKIAFFDLNNSVLVHGKDVVGDSFELEDGQEIFSDEIDRDFVTDNFSLATPDITIFPPFFVDSVDFAGSSYFLSEDSFYPVIGEMFWQDRILKLFVLPKVYPDGLYATSNPLANQNNNYDSRDLLNSKVGEINFTVWR